MAFEADSNIVAFLEKLPTIDVEEAVKLFTELAPELRLEVLEILLETGASHYEGMDSSGISRDLWHRQVRKAIEIYKPIGA